MLLDSSGRVVGINTAIFSSTASAGIGLSFGSRCSADCLRAPQGSSVGIGFAIPIDLVKRVLPDLAAKGRVDRVDLGISVRI